jgi:hypothetical protein
MLGGGRQSGSDAVENGEDPQGWPDPANVRNAVKVLTCRISSSRVFFDEVAHRHVFDHALTQRADGFLAHRGAPFLG